MIRVGILGGGQLAQMLTQAAIGLGIETAIYERQADSPAARLTPYQQIGTWQDLNALREFARGCDVITLENEFVDATPLAQLTQEGVAIYPHAATLATIQDKLMQKQRFAAARLAVPEFRGVSDPAQVSAAAESFGYPLVLKARYGGYDGYGNATIHHADEIEPAWAKLADRPPGLMVEAFVPFIAELAVMVLRGRDGEIRTYPVVETVQQNHICHVVRAPGRTLIRNHTSRA